MGSFDEFLYLNNIQNLENSRKIDIINANFNASSSGLLILQRLKKKGMITEEPDPGNDQRSKLIGLTKQGQQKLNACYKLLDKVNQVIFKEMKTHDILLCIRLLKPIETKFSKLGVTDKKLGFDAVYQRELKNGKK